MRAEIFIERDSATPTMRAVSEGLSDRTRLNHAAAEGAVVPIKRNFRKLAQTNHNKLGAPSSGFWQRMQQGTYTDADSTAGYIGMPREVALRYFGGTVVPKVAANLALPARTEAYNKSPRDFTDLRLVVFGAGGAMALVQTNQQAISYRKTKKGVKVVKGAVKGGLVFYWLAKSATIDPDPTVLPDEATLTGAANNSVSDYVDLLKRRASR
jgi:hypothetical protein